MQRQDVSVHEKYNKKKEKNKKIIIKINVPKSKIIKC